MLEVPDVDFIRLYGFCGFCYVLLSLGLVLWLVLCWLFVVLVFSYQCVCLLNAFAICVGEVTVFYLKVIVLFLDCVGVLFV